MTTRSAQRLVTGLLLAGSLLSVDPVSAGPIALASLEYEPVHNKAPLGSGLKGLGITPEKKILIKVDGDPGLRVRNDTGFDIVDLHWRIPTSEEVRGKELPLESFRPPKPKVPADWNQPDVNFKAQGAGDKEAGDSDIFKNTRPAGPVKELTFKDGIVKHGESFTDSKEPAGQGSIVLHYAEVSYSVESKATEQSTGGESKKSLIFDPITGALSLTPFELSSAYVGFVLDFLDVSRVDPAFAGDPILGATVTVTPFTLGYGSIRDGVERFYFGNSGGILTVTKGLDTFLTASLDSGAVFDPTQNVPFFAPLTDIVLNTAAGSNFITEMQARLSDPSALAFDFFISPDVDFVQATAGFTTFGDESANAGVAQNGHSRVSEPSSLALLCIGVLALVKRVARSGQRRRWHSR